MAEVRVPSEYMDNFYYSTTTNSSAPTLSWEGTASMTWDSTSGFTPWLDENKTGWTTTIYTSNPEQVLERLEKLKGIYNGVVAAKKPVFEKPKMAETRRKQLKEVLNDREIDF